MAVSLTRRSQAGDTIVEVIIAVAVIATILAGAFAVTTRSQRAVRDSEEHAQALQALQGQVELLRAAAATPGKLTATILAQNFCLDQSLVNHPGGSGGCAGASGVVPFTLRIACSPQSAGCPAGSGTTTFNLKASWPALGGGTDQVLLSYKVAVE